MDNFVINLIFLLAVIADLRLGDRLTGDYHPVIAIGYLIKRGEDFLYPDRENPRKEFFAGLFLTIAVVAVTYCFVKILLFTGLFLGIYLYYLLFFYLVYAVVACGGLADEARNVLLTLQSEGLIAGRTALGRIVGRETAQLDEDEIYRAVIETVAENFSDGVVAPLFYFWLGGLPLAWAYKAVNTLDSMLGYKNRHYLYFGRAAAYLDDLANFIPARLSGLLIIAAAMIKGRNWREGWRILKRDSKAHSSPNSGYPEAAMAGVLGLRLGGDNFYHGRLVKKPFIGDPLNQVAGEYIFEAVNILYSGSIILISVAVIGC